MGSGQNQNAPLLVVLMVCIVAVAGAMVAAVLVASSRSVVVVMPDTGVGAASAAAPGPAKTPAAPSSVASTGGAASGPPAPKAVATAVMRVPSAPRLDDPFDPAWETLPVTEVPMQPQQMTMPMLDNATISAVSFQGARDDHRIVFRLTWAARSPMSQTETGEFGDAVAIQFPMVDGAPFTMGAKGQPVCILLWKALWQKDLDEGFQTVTDHWPNAWTDTYVFPPGSSAETRPAGEVPAMHPLGYEPLRAAGNPMADTARRQPVEELIAEGFGTLTHTGQTLSSARGRWRDGKWSVIIDRPLKSDDPLVQRLTSASQNLMSLAVWDGSSANRGGRKHYCAWIPLKIEP